MKVLQVNSLFRNGSTGKIMADVHDSLCDAGVESIVCYGRGPTVKEPNAVRLCSDLYAKANKVATFFTGLMYGGCRMSTSKLLSVIRREKPDVVHLHCINGNFVNIYRLVSFLKKNRIKTVLTLHAEFMYTGNCGHAFDCDRWLNGCGQCPRLKKETKSLFLDRTHTSWERMRQAFDGFEDLVVTSVSPWLMERAKRSPVLGDKDHCVVFNGLDTNVFFPVDAAPLRKKLGLTHEKIVFHATPHFSDDPSHLKGGYYIIKLAERLKGENVRFVVAGRHDPEMSLPENIILLGQITDQRELAGLYALADVTVIASKRETFSMVCAESLCCGTPVVGFRAGGPEQISIPQHSCFCEYGDVDALEKAVRERLADQRPFDPAETAVYSKEEMCARFLGIYQKLMQR